MSEYWLTTGRLALRRFTGDDLDWLACVYADADVTQYLGGTKDRTQTQEMLEIRILDYYSELPRRHALCAGEAAIRF